MQDNDLIEQFLDALWIERNLAQNTLTSYRQDLLSLTGWLAHHQRSLLGQTRPIYRLFLPSASRAVIKPPARRAC